MDLIFHAVLCEKEEEEAANLELTHTRLFLSIIFSEVCGYMDDRCTSDMELSFSAPQLVFTGFHSYFLGVRFLHISYLFFDHFFNLFFIMMGVSW